MHPVVGKREHFEPLVERYKNDDPASEEEVWIAIKMKREAVLDFTDGRESSKENYRIKSPNQLGLTLIRFLCLPILTINAYFWTLVHQGLFIVTFSALLVNFFGYGI